MTTMSKAKAKQLDDEIHKTADAMQDAAEMWEYEFDELTRLLEDAMTAEIWKVLGYESWAGYCVEAVGLNPTNLDERRACVLILMNTAKLSTRTIGKILDISHDTVWRDAGHLSDLLTVDKVEGLDGKSRPAQGNPTNKRDRSKPELTPVLRYTKVFNSASEECSKLIDQLTSDDEMACEAVKELVHLREMRDGLTKLIKHLSAKRLDDT